MSEYNAIATFLAGKKLSRMGIDSDRSSISTVELLVVCSVRSISKSSGDRRTGVSAPLRRIALKRVLTNLIENALKYNENTPEIRITAKLQSQDIVISFEDNGIGIPVSQRSLIFEKFQRVHQTTHAFKGFGLGLAYVKNMLELHKGNIQVKSEDKKACVASVQR